jgi:cellulose synthase/poly-beta-1,6-N-acetylglucosamine synthase-like glycosyltransferase
MSTAEMIILWVLSTGGLAYSALITLFTIGWAKLQGISSSNPPSVFVSIVLAVRNEEENIGKILTRLIEQDYPGQLFEIIVVNDHSSDQTPAVLHEFSTFPGLKILHAGKGMNGKKQALSLGIGQAQGRLIATVDADCFPGRRWLRTMVHYYEKTGSRMVAGPVAIRKPGGFLSSFQALELLSLVASGAGAAQRSMPVMCNGANLLYEKEAYKEAGGFGGNMHIGGGDDMFLLEKFIRLYRKKSLTFAKDRKAMVHTYASANLRSFIQQRFRWVAKSPAYRNGFLVFTAVAVMFFNLGLLTSLIVSAFIPGVFLLFLAAFLVKCIIDFPILWMAAGFADQRKLMAWYLPFQLIYFVFISLSGIGGNLLSYNWKGRNKR